MGEHVLAAATDFRTNHHTAMSVFHLTMTNDDVLARHATCSSIPIPSAFNGNAVIACVEEAMFNQYTIARFRVTSVTVRAIIVDVHSSYSYIHTFQGMNDPEGGTQQGHIFYQNTFALIETHQLWTHSVIGSEGS